MTVSTHSACVTGPLTLPVEEVAAAAKQGHLILLD